MRTETRHKRKKLLCLLLVLCMMLGIMPTSVFAEGTKTEQTVTEETTAPETEQEEISSEPEATTEPASESMVETEEAEETETSGENPGDSGSGEQKTKASLTRGSISPFSLPADRTSEISFENVVLTVNGTVVEEADDGGTFTIKYSNTSIIKFDWTANEDASFVSGDYFTFTVPEDFGSRMSTDGLAMTAVDGTVMGVIIFTKNTDGTYTATAIFNENVESLTNVSGTVKLQVTYAGMESKPVSWTFVLGEDEYIYEGSAEIRITGISDVAERVIAKGGSYQSNNNAYLWTMFFNEQTEKLTGTVTITDVLGSGQRITPYKGTTKGQYDYKIDYPAGDDNYYFRIRLIDYDTMRTDYNAMAVEYNVNGYEGLTASSKVLFDFLVNYSSNYAFIGTDGKIATVADNRITNFMKDGLVWTPDSTKPSTYRYIVDLGELGIDHYIELTEEGFMISLTDVGEYGVWIRYYTEATALMEQSKLENTAYLGTSKTTTSVNIGSSATVTGVRGSITLIKSNTHETKMFTGVEFVLEDDQGAKLTAKTNASGVLAFKLADFNYYDFTGTYTLTENPATTPAGYQCAAPITLELDASGAIVKINGQSVSATSGLTIEEVCRVTQDGLMITVYNKEYPSLTLTGTKTLTDHTDEGKTLKDYTFDFTVKDEDKKTVAEGTSNASGRITFDEITFTSSGTYTYKVTENVGSEAEMTYDTAEYTVVVVVAQNTVTEDLSIESIMVNGNAVSGTSNIAAAIVFDNTYGSIDEPVFVERTVTKTWSDSDNQDGKRPASIQVQLYAGANTYGSAVTLNAGNDWTYTWDNLPEKQDATDVVYTVRETGVPIGYTANYITTATGFNIINSYTPEKVDVGGTKTWNDADDRDGKRSTSITVNLLANGKEIDEKTVTADDDWAYAWTSLPKYSGGTLINYSITEDPVPDYGTVVSGYDITNSYTPGETSRTVTKAWEDEDDQDGKRPGSIQVQLYADGTVYGPAITLNETNEWTHTWNNLPEMQNKKTVVYTVREMGVPTDYTAGYDEDGFAITNSYTPETVDVGGTKTWNDADDQDGKRPGSITVNLLANGKEIDEKTVTADDDWAYAWTSLPKYSGGTLINYSITEDPVPDYGTVVSGYDITNSYTPGETSRTVTKAWEDEDDQDGKRPGSIQVQLYADGTEYGPAITLNETNEWTHIWNNLPEMQNKKTVVYTVREMGVPTDYTAGYSEDGFAITNSYTPETVDVGGTKTWNDANDQDGKRPGSITVNLLANGTEIDEKTVTSDDDWAYAWTSLPKYSGGTLISYSITEDPVPNYGTVVTGYDITNSYTPGETSRTVTKAWEDEDDQDGKRPGSIQVQLYADGTVYGPAITLNEVNEWTHTWNNLPEMQNKETVVYTVREMGVPTDYTAGYSEDGFAITNSYTPETVDVGGTKTWNDANDQDGKRPGSITVNLLANGTEIDEKTVTTDDDWAYAWTSLPKYSGGTLISYSITEDPVPNYGTVVTGYDITNSYTPGETSRTVVKVWEDVNDYVNIRPGMIQVQLYANGKAYGDAVTLNVANNWIHTWNNLPERQNGQIIVYTVEEVEVPESYVVSYSEDGFVITNTSLGLKDYEVTDISGTKTWDDNNDQDEKRPDSITVNLYANGTLQSSKTVTADDDWKYEWTGLLRYESGVEIQYTITENPVTDYSTEVDGYNITNTYTPGETSRTVKKIWNDKKDSDGIRPKSIKVQLYADGTAVGDTVKLNADNNWKHTWSGLAESEDGETVVYTVKEVKVPTGYTVSYSSDTFVITNKHNVTSNKNDDGNNNNGSNNNGYNNTRSNTINPKTGDYSNMVLWSLLLLAACAAMIFALYFNRKKRIQK